MRDISENSYKKVEFLFKFSEQGEPNTLRLSPLKPYFFDQPGQFRQLYNRLARWNLRISSNSSYITPSAYEALKLIYSEMLFMKNLTPDRQAIVVKRMLEEMDRIESNSKFMIPFLRPKRRAPSREIELLSRNSTFVRADLSNLANRIYDDSAESLHRVSLHNPTPTLNRRSRLYGEQSLKKKLQSMHKASASSQIIRNWLIKRKCDLHTLDVRYSKEICRRDWRKLATGSYATIEPRITKPQRRHPASLTTEDDVL